MSIFSLDSKFMQAMSRIADLILLNLLFLVTSLPIFTIGAAATAMYTISMRMGTPREEGVFRPYFRAFRENFKQGTLLFLILFLPAVLLLVNFFFLMALTGPIRYLTYLYIPMLLLLAFVASYTFPLLSQFGNTIARTLKNALYLSIGYLPRTLVMTALNLLPLGLFYAQTLFFFQLGFIWVLLYFSTAAYLNGLLMRKVLAPYLSEEEESE